MLLPEGARCHPPLTPEIEDAVDRPRDRELLIRVDDPYLDGAGIRRNQRRILCIALPV